MSQPTKYPLPTSHGLACCPCRSCEFIGIARTVQGAEAALQEHLLYHTKVQRFLSGDDAA